MAIKVERGGEAVQLQCSGCGGVNRIPAQRLDQRPVCGRCRTALRLDQPVELSDATFASFVKASALPVLVDFWAPWCAPCRMVAPELEQLARERQGQLVVAKLNSDENPHSSSQFRVQAIPTMILFRGGAEAQRLQGAMRAPQILASLGL